MAKFKLITCDVCGKTIRTHYVHIRGIKNPRRSVSIRNLSCDINPKLDVCSDCYNKMKQWIRTESKGESE